MYRADHGLCASPGPIPEVACGGRRPMLTEAFESLTIECDGLHQAIAVLRDRLQPLLRPEPQGGTIAKDCAPRACGPPLVEAFRDRVAAVAAARAELLDIVNLLEV